VNVEPRLKECLLKRRRCKARLEDDAYAGCLIAGRLKIGTKAYTIGDDSLESGA